MIIETDECEDIVIKIHDLLLSLHASLDYARSINSDMYFLETLAKITLDEYDKLMDKLLF